MSLECSLVKNENKNETILCQNTGISIIFDLKLFTLDLSPKNASKLSLSELFKNGLSSLQNDQPVKNHSIFIIKMIYEQVCQYYYGDK